MPSKVLTGILKRIAYEPGGRIYHPLILQMALENAAAQRIILVSPFIPTKKKHRPCSVPECNRPVNSQGYCRGHYKRLVSGYEIGGRLIDVKATRELTRMNRRIQNKLALMEVMGGECLVCKGVFHHAIYDFHHVGDKTQEPAAILRSINYEKIAAELCHCVLLCANCHRLEHINEKDESMVGSEP